MNQIKSQNNITIIAGAIISCFIGFYNGYPLVYPDTGTYLATGFDGTVPADRTIFYGLFARHISLSASPWLIIFMQGLLISWLLHTTFGIFFNGTKRNLLFLASVVFITLTTGFSFIVSILIPDIFSPIALLCLINLLFHNELGKFRTVIISALFVFSLSTHLSNIPTFGLLLFILIGHKVYNKIRNRDSFIHVKKILFPVYLLCFTLILVPTLHFLIGNKFQYSNGSHVFMVNHLIECGVMEQYLEDECENYDYKICSYKDQLGWNFIWDKESPLVKTGGWIGNKEEYNKILYNVYSSPKYWPILIQKTIEYTFKQFFSFSTMVHSHQLQGTAPFGQINWRFHDSVREYISSKQNNDKLNIGFLNYIQTCVMLISLVVLFMAFTYPYFSNMLSPNLKWIMIIALIYGVINSAICANLSTIDPRFQNRWIWILPVLAILGLYYILRNENLKFQTKNKRH